MGIMKDVNIMEIAHLMVMASDHHILKGMTTN
jgi:hypothetical protein